MPPLCFDEFRTCVCKLLFCVLQMVRASVQPHLPDVLLLRQDHLRGQQKGEPRLQPEMTVQVVFL